jgi:hypothetical protein
LSRSACADGLKLFIGNVTYAGPSRVEQQDVWVDLDSLAKAVGWVVDRHGNATCLHRPNVSCPEADSGFYVEAKPYDGAVRTEGTATWLDLTTLSRFLGGRGTYDEHLGLAQYTIPGMPIQQAQNPMAALIQQLSLKPYTIVLFIVSTDPYSEHYLPVVRTYCASRSRARLVEVDFKNKTTEGPNWIYDTFKTPTNGFPELVLLNSQGHVLQKLLGETDVKTLQKELDPLMP